MSLLTPLPYHIASFLSDKVRDTKASAIHTVGHIQAGQYFLLNEQVSSTKCLLNLVCAWEYKFWCGNINLVICGGDFKRKPWTQTSVLNDELWLMETACSTAEMASTYKGKAHRSWPQLPDELIRSVSLSGCYTRSVAQGYLQFGMLIIATGSGLLRRSTSWTSLLPGMFPKLGKHASIGIREWYTHPYATPWNWRGI